MKHYHWRRDRERVSPFMTQLETQMLTKSLASHKSNQTSEGKEIIA